MDAKTKNRIIPLLPFALVVIGLLLVLIANVVTGFNKEQFYFREKAKLASIRDTVSPEIIWNTVAHLIETNRDPGNELARAKSKYFEHKVEISVAGVITAFSLLLLLVTSCFIFYRNIGAMPNPGKWIATSICSAISIVFTILLWASNPITSSGPVNDLVKLIKDYEGGHIINVFGRGIASLAGLSVSWLVFACCSLLYYKEENGKDTGTISQIGEARLLLGISSLSLAAGVIINYFFHSWSSPLVQDPSQIVRLANLLTVSVGVLFTFLLLILFTPVALIHQKRLARLRKKIDPAIGWNQVIREVLTCLIPILVAAIAQWLGYKA
jgi:hypothetical protein